MKVCIKRTTTGEYVAVPSVGQGGLWTFLCSQAHDFHTTIEALRFALRQKDVHVAIVHVCENRTYEYPIDPERNNPPSLDHPSH